MASHSQINKNVGDVNSAWGQLQALFHSYLPSSAGSFTALNRVVQRRKHYA